MRPNFREMATGGHMTDKISDFLREIDLQNASKGTWGVGRILTRSGAKAAQALMSVSVKSAEDQFIIPASNELVIPIIAETLGKIGLGLKDPALFDIPTATFAVFMGQQILGRMTGACLVFITLRAVSDNSTHLLIEGYAKELFKNNMASSWVRKCAMQLARTFRERRPTIDRRVPDPYICCRFPHGLCVASQPRHRAVREARISCLVPARADSSHTQRRRTDR